jgi:hypothetical protein
VRIHQGKDDCKPHTHAIIILSSRPEAFNPSGGIQHIEGKEEEEEEEKEGLKPAVRPHSSQR